MANTRKVSDLEQGLREATKLKPKANEDRQAWLTRLWQGACNLKQEDWDDLHDDEAEWVNAATRADNGRKEIPDFSDGDDPEQSDGARGEGDSDMAAKRNAGKSGGGKGGNKGGSGKSGGARKTADKEEKAETGGRKQAAAPTRASGGGGSKGPSARRRVKIMVVRNPAISNDKLKEKFGSELSDLSISSIRADTLDTMRVLKSEDLLAKSVKLDD